MSATKINFTEIYRRHLTWKRPRQRLDNPQICRISSIIESRTCRTSWGENWRRPGPEILAYFRQHHRHRCVCVLHSPLLHLLPHFPGNTHAGIARYINLAMTGPMWCWDHWDVDDHGCQSLVGDCKADLYKGQRWYTGNDSSNGSN